MSHPVNDAIFEEISQGLESIRSRFHDLRDYISAEDRIVLLTRNEVELLNKIHFAFESYDQGGGVSPSEFKHKYPNLADVVLPKKSKKIPVKVIEE